MSDVFISYARADAIRADQVSDVLQQAGLSVWIDRRGIETGRAYDLQIEEALRGATCVVVLWSETSVKSDWVRTEAAEAYRLGKLIPVLTDRAMPPLQLKSVHAINLSTWVGSHDAPDIQELVAAVRKRTKGTVESASPPPKPPMRNSFRTLLDQMGIAFADRALERQFSAFFVDRFIDQTRMYLVLGAVVFGIFSVTEFILGSTSPIAALVEFVLTPIIVTAFLLTLWPPTRKVWRFFVVGASLGAAALISFGLRKTAISMDEATAVPMVCIFLLGTMTFLGLIPSRALDTALVCVSVLIATIFSASLAGASHPIAREYVETAISVCSALVISGWWRERQARRWFSEASGRGETYLP
ncbi:MAG: TIR domain-containing protein [Devosia sp.]